MQNSRIFSWILNLYTYKFTSCCNTSWIWFFFWLAKKEQTKPRERKKSGSLSVAWHAFISYAISFFVHFPQELTIYSTDFLYPNQNDAKCAWTLRISRWRHQRIALFSLLRNLKTTVSEPVKADRCWHYCSHVFFKQRKRERNSPWNELFKWTLFLSFFICLFDECGANVIYNRFSS